MVVMQHRDPLRVVGTALEVVDLAWNAIERCQDHATQDASRELRRELELERIQNAKLRATLQDYAKALQNANASSLATPPADLCEQLTKKVNSTDFLEKLKDLEKEKAGSPNSFVEKSEGDMMENINPEDHSGWILITEDYLAPEPKEEHNMLDNDSYFIVSQDDVIEGMAFFLARAVYSSPKAQDLTPNQLLEVLSLSFAKMEAKGMIHKLWDVVKFGYITASWSIAIYGVYKHPLILKAAFKTILLSCRCLVRVFI